MRIRDVTSEHEAHLAAVAGAPEAARSARGKGEWKRYADGSRRCKVSVSRLDLPDGTAVALAISGRALAEERLAGGRVRYRRETERGERVEDVAPGDTLQVIVNGQPVLEGRFEAE